MAGFAPPIAQPAEAEQLQSTAPAATQYSDEDLASLDPSYVPNSLASQWATAAGAGAPGEGYGLASNGAQAALQSIDPTLATTPDATSSPALVLTDEHGTDPAPDDVDPDVEPPPPPFDESGAPADDGGSAADGGAGGKGDGASQNGGTGGDPQDSTHKGASTQPGDDADRLGGTATPGAKTESKKTGARGAGGSGGAGGGAGGVGGAGGAGASGEAGGRGRGGAGGGSAADADAALDDRLRRLLEENQDPAVAKQHDDLLIKADMARLAALQYSYTPNDSFLMGLGKSMLPLHQMGERITAMWSGNQYASAANASNASGRIAKVQSVIEGYRQAVRLVGDVVGAGASVLGYVGIISGLIGLIPIAAPIALPIAAFAGSMSLTLGLIKAFLDFVDVLLGGVQLALLAVRARTESGKNPAERARIAMMMRREAGQVTSSLTNATVGIITYKLGKLSMGKVPDKAILKIQSDAVKAGLQRAGSRLVAGNIRGAFSRDAFSELATVARSIKAAQAVGAEATHLFLPSEKGRFRLLMENVLPKRAVNWLNAPPPALTFELSTLNQTVYRDRLGKEIADVNLKAEMYGKGWLSTRPMWLGAKIRGVKPKIPSYVPKVPAGAVKLAQSQGRRQTAAQGTSVRAPAKAPQATETAPAQDPAAAERHLYWPTVLERYATMRTDIANARERTLEQHKRAKLDAGPRAANAVLKIKTTADRVTAQLGGAGTQIGTQATADAQAATVGAAAAEDAKKQDEQARAKRAGGDDARAEARRDAEDVNKKAVDAAVKVREQPGLLARAKAWVMKKIGRAVASLQEDLTEWILSATMSAGGISSEGLSIDEMGTEAAEDLVSSAEAKKAADEIAAEQELERKAMARLLEGASDSEQNAIHGVADTFDLLHDLDTWDAALSAQQDGGRQYLQAVSAMFAPEESTLSEPDLDPVEPTAEAQSEPVVDAATIAPIAMGATQVADYADAAGAFEADAGSLLRLELQKVGEAFAPSGLAFDTSEGEAIAHPHLEEVAADLDVRLTAARAAAAGLATQAAGLIGSADLAAIDLLSKEMDAIVAQVETACADATRYAAAVIQAVVDAYVELGMQLLTDEGHTDAAQPVGAP